jgi:hypothetical protein
MADEEAVVPDFGLWFDVNAKVLTEHAARRTAAVTTGLVNFIVVVLVLEGIERFAHGDFRK